MANSPLSEYWEWRQQVDVKHNRDYMIVVFMIVLVTKYDSYYFNLESPIVWFAFLNNFALIESA